MTSIAVVGLGPVGVATGVSFALQGHHVRGYDIDPARRAQLSGGDLPFHERGLGAALRKVIRDRLFRVDEDLDAAIGPSTIIFLCVGTPPRPDGTMDDGPIRSATEAIARSWGPPRPRTVVVKSTVIPGTTEEVVRPLLQAAGHPFRIASNPEFLREGRALPGSLRPDRVVLGVEDQATSRRLRSLYSFVRCPILVTDVRTAEAVKYATNAFLATKIAFADELANLCDAFGVSYDEVHRGLSLDPRVNPTFLVPGVGPGGSCLPKDVRALAAAAARRGRDAPLLRAVISHNESQYHRAVDLLQAELGSLAGKRIAILGLAFKGETDDVRESRAVPIAHDLLEAGAVVIGYDPMAGPNFARVLPQVQLASSVSDALHGADGCVVQADWPEVAKLSAKTFLGTMRVPVVVDGRRILDPRKMRGVRFRRIG